DPLDLLQQLGTYDQRSSARIVQNVSIVSRFPQRVDRNRDGADLDRTEEAVRERRAVVQEQHDALFAADVEEAAECTSNPVHALVKLVVGDPLVTAFDRHGSAAALDEVAIDEVRGNVEGFGDAQRGGVR